MGVNEREDRRKEDAALTAGEGRALTAEDREKPPAELGDDELNAVAGGHNWFTGPFKISPNP